MLKKRTWIVTLIIFLLIALCVSLWQYTVFKNDKIEVMCKGSVSSALGHFEKYDTNGKEADYMAGVAEFRAYMSAYLCLAESARSETNYIWYKALYGYMTLSPEKVKAHVSELVEALEYLAEDYDDPDGFSLINALNNQLEAE